MAVNCGTPTPAIILVVQIDPGPIPTFIPSAPESIKALVAAPVATFPPINSTLFFNFDISLTVSKTIWL